MNDQLPGLENAGLEREVSDCTGWILKDNTKVTSQSEKYCS